MFKKDAETSFYGVALSFIIFGTIIFVFGLISWYISAVGGISILSFPFLKVIGGLIIMALGYILLEIEIIRKK